MAICKSTRKKYPHMYDIGKTYYHSLIYDSYRFFNDKSILNDNFHMTEFYTDNQVGYYDRFATYVWFKCHISAETCFKILTESDLVNFVDKFALITHDKDLDEDGGLKPPHTHCLLKFYRNEKMFKLLEYFHADNVSNSVNLKYVRFKYLTHDSEKCRKEGKYQYDTKEILSNDIEYFNNLEEDIIDNGCINIINDIIAGKTERYLCNKYGDRYVYNKLKYKDSANIIALEENIKLDKDFTTLSVAKDVVAIYDTTTGELLEIKKNILN